MEKINIIATDVTDEEQWDAAVIVRRLSIGMPSVLSLNQDMVDMGGFTHL